MKVNRLSDFCNTPYGIEFHGSLWKLEGMHVYIFRHFAFIFLVMKSRAWAYGAAGFYGENQFG